MTKHNCLVTGGAGFIGSSIVDLLIENGHTVIVIDNLSTGHLANINTKALFYRCDLNLESQTLINSYFQNIDYVFHCAALPNVQFSVEYPKESNDANVNCTIKVLTACLQNNIKKIIYSGSSSVYGNATIFPTPEDEKIAPISPYALQKYIGEQYCELYNRMYGIQYVILRYFNVFGERMTNKGAYVSVISHFLRAFKNNYTLKITNNGEQKRDFIHVKDIARANIVVMTDEKYNNQVFNIGNGENYSINAIASLFNKPTKYSETRIEPYETLADITKAKKILGWKPETNILEWITTTIKDM
jgi:UDP-glucose 4-epimerase